MASGRFNWKGALGYVAAGLVAVLAFTLAYKYDYGASRR